MHTKGVRELTMKALGLVFAGFLLMLSIISPLVVEFQNPRSDLGIIGNISGQSSWVQFEKGFSKPANIKVLESGNSCCVLDVTTYGMYRKEVSVEGMTFQNLSIPGCGFLYDVGKPMLPALRGLIEVPLGKSVKVKATALTSLGFLEYTVYPAQKLVAFSEQETEGSTFQLDQTFYSLDTVYPDVLASVSAPFQARNHNFVHVSVYPVRYYPAFNRLNVSNRIRIKLEYCDLGKELVCSDQSRFYSPAFDEAYKPFVWDSGHGPQILEKPEGYLIICHDDFYTAMDRFVEWKRANGLEVTCVTLSDIALNATDVDVYNYVRNAYYNWTLPPTYLLLVGDSQYVPTHYGVLNCDLTHTATDHYYACMSENDYFPDIFVGRLSVENVTELNNILDKLIDYKGFVTKRATVICAFASSYTLDIDSICDMMKAEGYEVEFLDTYERARPQQIANSVNNGLDMLTYDGHGSISGWDGSFYSPNVYTLLNNTGRYPVVFSMACETGHFDTVRCFGEAWIRAAGRGAIAFLGFSRTAEGPLGYLTCKGFHKAIFVNGVCNLGAATAQAKLYLYYAFGDIRDTVPSGVPESGQEQPKTQAHFEMLNLLSDPHLAVSPPRPSPVCITSDGTVANTVKIHRNGSTYTFTENINDSILVEKSNITIDGNGFTIQGNNGGVGFSLCMVTNVTIKNTNIKGFGKGIFIDHSSNITLFKNNVRCNYVGFWLTYSVNCTLSENNLTDNHSGIKNVWIGDFGYEEWATWNEHHTLIEKNNIANNTYGIELRLYSGNKTITLNKIIKNDFGIVLDLNSVNNSICENNITENGIGIMLNYLSSNNLISRNDVASNDIGIMLRYHSGDNLISENNIIENGKYGIYVENSANNVFSENNISMNGECGIRINQQIRNIISKNNIIDNACGIELNHTFWTEINRNIIGNNDVGARFSDISYCHILYNNFADNGLHALVERSYNNKWDSGYPLGGNYWSGYVCADSKCGCYQNETGSDGIGDIEYVIDADNIDGYPFIAKCKIFDVGKWIGRDYFVTVISNSNVSDFIFNVTDYPHAMLTFNVKGENGTVGFCGICIPKFLINKPYIVRLDEEVIDYPQVKELLPSNETYGFFYINYTHTQHSLEISGITTVPEFPSLLVLPPFMIVTILAAIFYKREHTL